VPEEPRQEVRQDLQPAPAETTPAANASPSANVVTMPARPATESQNAPTQARQYAAERAADDLADEDMAGQARRSVAGTANGPDQIDQNGESFDNEEPIGQPRSAAETAEQDLAYRESSRALDSLLQQANPGMQAPGVVGFEHVVQSFYLSAIMAMGAGAEPGQKPRVDILAARQSIDMLSVIEAKTKGNLSPEEQQLVQGISFELRMMFLELTNAISAQAHQPAPGGMQRPVPPGGSLR
jgi:hypothetical protein